MTEEKLENSGTSGRLSRLVQNILESAGPDGSWTFPTDMLVQWLGLTPEVLYRALYQLKERIDYWDALDSLSSHRSGDLVTILESLCGPSAEEILRKAGLFFSHDDHVELMDIFVRTAGQAVSRHTPDYDQFQAMLRVAKRFSDALRIYYDEYFPIGPLMEAVFEAFSIHREWPSDSVAYRLVTGYLESLFQRHILSREQLFTALEGVFRSRFFESEAKQEEAAALASEDSRALHAMSLMGLSDRKLDRMALQARYRFLMKRYHPDVNPQGLEMCKQVNVAYAFLLPLCQE